MQRTPKTPRRGPPPHFLTGTNGTTGTALSGAGFSRPGSGTTPGHTGTSKPQRAVTGNGLLTRPPGWPLFSGAKVARWQPLSGQFFLLRIIPKFRPAWQSARVSVDNMGVFLANVDNFLACTICTHAYFLGKTHKTPEGLPGAVSGRIGAKVMHRTHDA